MNSPQERIDEYFQRHDSAGVGRSPIRAAEIRKLFTQTIAELEAACTQMREALSLSVLQLTDVSKACSEIIDWDQIDGDTVNNALNACAKALSSDCGKELLERLNKLEDRLKTAASVLRYAVYERTPLGDKWIDHFDIERQKAITEFLASVEGKP